MHADEPLRRDADDHELDGVQTDPPADDIRASAEFTLPHPVADDDDGAAAGHLILFRKEDAAERRPDVERGERSHCREGCQRNGTEQ